MAQKNINEAWWSLFAKKIKAFKKVTGTFLDNSSTETI